MKKVIVILMVGAGGCAADSGELGVSRVVTQAIETGVAVWLGSGLCIEVDGSSSVNGANVLMGTCDANADNQRWEFVPRPDGSYRIRAQHSGKCMVAVGKPAVVGDNIQQGRCRYQRSKWLVTELASDVVRLQNVKSGLCAERVDTGTNIQQTVCSTDDRQRLGVMRLCPDGQAFCGGECVSQFDMNHCGGICGNRCPAEAATCDTDLQPSGHGITCLCEGCYDSTSQCNLSVTSCAPSYCLTPCAGW